MLTSRRGIIASRVLFAILAVLAAVSIIAGLRNANLEYGSTDFQYSAAKLLLLRVNPYELYPVDPNRFLLTQGPNYLPLLYLLLLPVGALDWPTARLVWSIINALIGLFVAGKLGQAFGKARSSPLIGALAALIFIASTPFRNTIGNGQHGLLVAAALILAIESRSKLVRGALLAVAATKLSLGAMFVSLLAALRMWRAVAVCGALTVLSFAIFGAMTQTALGLDLLLGPIHAVQAGIHYTPPINWLVEAYGADAAIALNIAVLAAFLAGGLCFWRQLPGRAVANARTGSIPPRLILAATLLALLSAPHFIYDYVLLAVPFATGDPFKLLSRWYRIVFGCLLAFACFGQKIAYTWLPAEFADTLFVAMWLGLAALAVDCLSSQYEAGLPAGSK